MTDRNAKSRDRLPSLDLLPAFEAAARTLSFTRAAEELFVTQSAISKQIKQLENDVAVPLFERRPRALVLTEAGRRLSVVATEVLDTLRGTIAGIRRSERTNEISVTMTTGFASMWLIPRLERFTARHPDVDVRIAATMATLDFARDRIDVAIRICPLSSAPPGGVRLFSADTIAVCHPRLLNDAIRPLREPVDIAQHTLLRCEDPLLRGSFMDWDTWLTALGLASLKPAATLTFGQVDQAIQAAAGGQGIALAQARIVESLIAAGTLVAPFGLQMPGERGFYVLTSPDGAQGGGQGGARGARVSAFVDWLVEEARG